jgi:O6-methylguanine-DNA--protein-cysteine methyltransferase
MDKKESKQLEDALKANPPIIIPCARMREAARQYSASKR